eukprot:5044278-Pyramimonas_sp.AAC.1
MVHPLAPLLDHSLVLFCLNLLTCDRGPCLQKPTRHLSHVRSWPNNPSRRAPTISSLPPRPFLRPLPHPRARALSCLEAGVDVVLRAAGVAVQACALRRRRTSDC